MRNFITKTKDIVCLAIDPPDIFSVSTSSQCSSKQDINRLLYWMLRRGDGVPGANGHHKRYYTRSPKHDLDR